MRKLRQHFRADPLAAVMKLRDVASRASSHVSQFAVLPALLIVCAASPSAAHQKWLWPSHFFVEKAPVWLSFDITWSDIAFGAEKGVGEQPISVVDPTGQRQTPASVFTGRTKSTAEFEATKDGTYRLEAVDPLTYWTRIERDGQEKWLKKPKDEVAEAKITRADYYWAKAVAYVTVGKHTEIAPPDKTDPLDLVLSSHPNEITARDEFEISALTYGEPLPDAQIKVFGPNATGHEPEQIVTCNSKGWGKLRFGVVGKHLVVCELERQVTDDPHADMHSFHFYLTIDVHPPNEKE
jgi:hypothetical protein